MMGALMIFCPADAVLAKLPFPSKLGWITVGAFADFQSRPVIKARSTQPPWDIHIGFGALARNPEHRRAKVLPTKMQKLKELRFTKCHSQALHQQ
jgi:hypothetical protein